MSCSYSIIPGLCLDSSWSPNCIWHCRPANWIASSYVTGCVPSTIPFRHWTYSKFNWTGSRWSIFVSEKKYFRRSTTVDCSSISCWRRLFDWSSQSAKRSQWMTKKNEFVLIFTHYHHLYDIFFVILPSFCPFVAKIDPDN